jgi:hypothetical protein
VKYGLKVWALASSQSRYVSNAIVYLGAGDVRAENELLGTNVVLMAVRGLEGRGHVIITDNFFTSVRLHTELLKCGFYATGTVKKGSKGFPDSLAGLSPPALVFFLFGQRFTDLWCSLVNVITNPRHACRIPEHTPSPAWDPRSQDALFPEDLCSSVDRLQTRVAFVNNPESY